MEFTEPVINREKTPKDDVSSENIDQSFPAMSRLESEIDDVYTSIESKISNFWNTASRSIHGSQTKEEKETRIKSSNKQEQTNRDSTSASSAHDDVPPGEESLNGPSSTLDPKIDLASISVQANKALDDLDSKLEIVEQRAGNLVSSLTSFFSNAVVSSSTFPDDKIKDTSPPLPIIPGDAYGSSRYDMELFKLHTTTDFFLDGALHDEAELREFKVDDKTQEISNLLGRYQGTLENLMNKLVPTEITYNEFWFRYFKQESKLKAAEKARKELLSRRDKGEEKEGSSLDKSEPEKASNKVDKQVKADEETKESEDEEDFLWDDDEEVETSDS